MADELSLRVPDIFRAPLDVLTRVSDAEFERMLAGLAELAIDDPSDLGVVALTGVAALSDREARMLLEFATQVRTVADRMGVDVAQVTTAVAQSHSPGDSTVLSSRAQALASHWFVAVREKVSALSRDPEPRLSSSRSLTDLRPVFSLDGSTEDVLGFVIIHTLILELDGDRVDRSINIRMDLPSLLSLNETIDRALKKHERLQQTLLDSDLSNLTMGESDA